MRTITILLLMMSSLGCENPQKQLTKMDDKIAIQETIAQMFVNSDNRNWEKVRAQFASKVLLDYSSMTGNPASEVSPIDITATWKAVLPGFGKTHHQIGNFITEVNHNKAHSFCYGTATHYLEDENGNIWTVVGSYDFDLEKEENQWKITSMAFNYKYQDGNGRLIEKAMENVKPE